MTSEIRTNSLKSRSGLSTVTMTDSGPMFSGITTFVDNSTFSVGTGGTIHAPTTNTLNIGVNNTESLRIDSSSNLKIAGVCTATHFYGNGSNLTGITGTTINNNADNRVITGSGSANTLEAESGLTFSSDRLILTNTSTPQIRINNDTNDGSSTRFVFGKATANNNFFNGAVAGDSCIGFPGDLLFGVGSSVKVRIDSSGRVLIGTATEGLATYGEELTLGSSDHAGMTIRSGTGHKGTIYFSDATSGDGEYIGSLQYDHSDNSMRFRIDGTDTLFINSSNNLKVPDNSELQFGGSLNSGNGDLRIYHTTSGTSWIRHTNTSEYFLLEGNQIDFRDYATGVYRARMGTSVNLYHNGSERAYTASDGFALSRVNTFPNPNNTGSEISGAMLDIGGNLHLQERYPAGAYVDRQDLVLQTNTGYGQGITDKLRITAGGAVCIYSSHDRSKNKGWTPGNLTLHNNNNDGDVDFTQGILFTDNANDDSDGGWMHGGIVCTGSTGYNGNMCFGIDGNGARNNNLNGITEKMRLLHNGKLMIGAASFASEISSSNAGVQLFNTSAGCLFSGGGTTTQNQLIFLNPNGVVGRIQTIGSSTSYLTSSDYRLKENQVPITDGIDKVKTLKPYRFNFKADKETTLQGFFAHEVSSAVPQAVDGEKDGTYPEDEGEYKAGDPRYQSLDQSKLIPLLTAALKDVIAKIETLEQENISLRSRVTNLEGE